MYDAGESITNSLYDAVLALPKPITLTINQDFVPIEKNDIESPFREIKIAPPSRAMDIPKIESQRTRPLRFKALAEAIEQSVYEYWNPNAFNLIFHSNGYDSRIMSYFIRKAYQERPGKILFVCFVPEYKNFVNIMKYEGWEPDQYAEYDSDWSDGIWDFDCIWQKVNGCSNIPWNKPMESLAYLRHKNLIPNDITTWGAVYCNETLGWKGTFNGFVDEYYYCRYSRMTQGYHVPCVQPLLNHRVLNVIFKAHPCKSHNQTRKALLQYIDPDLDAIKKEVFDINKHRRVPNPEFNELVRNYKQSYYFKVFNPSSVPSPMILDQNEWWGHLTMASFVEHLINHGVKVQ